MNRRESMRTQDINNITDPTKNYHLGEVSKFISLEGKPVSQRANLTFSSDVDQDTKMFGLHKRPLTYPCIIS